jgi:hypothetical protein
MLISAVFSSAHVSSAVPRGTGDWHPSEAAALSLKQLASM